MLLTVEYEARKTVNITATEAVEMGYPSAIVGAAAKRTAKSEVAQVANTYRAKLASTSAGKLQAYRIKEEIARDPANADPAELALIEREATARGISRDDLIALIAAQASAYRQIALLIEALEAEAGAAIAAIPDDAPDIETQISTVLGAAKAQAETAFNEALALINGGS